MNKHLIESLIHKEARKYSDGLTEYVQDLSQKIAQDQADWVDLQMKDILTPKLYEQGKRGDNLEQVESYLQTHGFKLQYVPDTFRVRITKHGQLFSEFAPQFTMDGAPVTFDPASTTWNETPENN